MAPRHTKGGAQSVDVAVDINGMAIARAQKMWAQSILFSRRDKWHVVLWGRNITNSGYNRKKT